MGWKEAMSIKQTFHCKIYMNVILNSPNRILRLERLLSTAVYLLTCLFSAQNFSYGIHIWLQEQQLSSRAELWLQELLAMSTNLKRRTIFFFISLEITTTNTKCKGLNITIFTRLVLFTWLQIHTLYNQINSNPV